MSGGDGDCKPKPQLLSEVRSLEEIEKGGCWVRLRVVGEDAISPRLGHSLVSPEPGRLSLLCGGTHEGALSDYWELDFGAREEPALKKLPVHDLRPRYEFLCTPQRGRLWIFGGADAKSTYGDVGYLEDGAWVEVLSGVGSRAPCGRTQGANSALLKMEWGRAHLAVFAGGKSGFDAVADSNLYLFDVEDEEWRELRLGGGSGEAPPPTVQGHVLTSFGSQIYVHGGLNGSTLHETLWMIDVDGGEEGGRCCWSPVEVDSSSSSSALPPGRGGHGIATFQHLKKFYIFGGLGQKGALGDLWEFDTETKSWKKMGVIGDEEEVEQPCPRFGVGMTGMRCGSSNYLILHGGMNTEGEAFNDFWCMRLD